MTRTNIEIDDDLIATVMEQNHLTTKREAVDFALRQTVRRPPNIDEIRGLQGIGFPYSNEEIKELSPVRDLW